MKRILTIFLFVALPAFAQQPSIDDMRAVAQAIAEQRNQALDQVAQLSVVLRKQEAESARLKAEVERLTKLCGKACEPKEEPKK